MNDLTLNFIFLIVVVLGVAAAEILGCSISCIGCVELAEAAEQFLFKHLYSCNLSLCSCVVVNYFSKFFHNYHCDHFNVLQNYHQFVWLKLENLLLVNVNNNTALNFSCYRLE